MAVRALGRFPTAPPALLVSRTADLDYRVAIQAFRSLAKVAKDKGDAAYAQALRARLDHALSPGVQLAGPELQVLLAAMQAAAPFARSSSTFGVATEALERFGRAPPSGEPSYDQAVAQCAAAKLVDEGRGWPSRVEHCGFDKVPHGARQVAAAEVVGAVSGADAQRASYLARLFASPDRRVREAVLEALPTVRDPAVRGIVLDALGSKDVGVLASACDAIVAIAAGQGQGEATGAGSNASPPVVSLRGEGPAAAGMVRALGAAGQRLRSTDELEGLQSWLGAVQALDARSLIGAVRPLTLHANLSVREKARDVLGALGGKAPKGAIPPSPNVLPASAFPAPTASLHATVQTTRGRFRIQLLPAEAPGTVARFTELARRHFFDGLTFHRVVPGFVAQGGDPRGDGYGGPGWSQRCEDNRVPYVRGTVGMALAGRDTGGSQFFITYGLEPHLDGHYTAFGRVDQGMEVVKRLQPGDVIRTLRIGS